MGGRPQKPCRLLITPIQWIVTRLSLTAFTLRCYPRTLGTIDLTGLSSNQVCSLDIPATIAGTETSRSRELQHHLAANRLGLSFSSSLW